MAIAYIQEYRDVAVDSKGRSLGIPMIGDSTKHQIVTFTTTTASLAFQKNTRFIRVLSDTACHYDVGFNPVAITASNPKMAANVFEYFGVLPGDKIAFVT